MVDTFRSAHYFTHSYSSSMKLYSSQGSLLCSESDIQTPSGNYIFPFLRNVNAESPTRSLCLTFPLFCKHLLFIFFFPVGFYLSFLNLFFQVFIVFIFPFFIPPPPRCLRLTFSAWGGFFNYRTLPLVNMDEGSQ